MWTLLLSTILTSAADSLNPIAITQQFVLQGMVKKPKHILYFIIPTGITNLIGGFLAYYGFVALIGNYMGRLIGNYGQILFIAELILGIALLIAVCYLIQNSRIESLKKQLRLLRMEEGSSDKSDEEEATGRIKSVSPAALITLGVGATISELTTALPYFAFLAILFNYHLTFLEITVILTVYNIIYTSPLLILYLIYRKARNKFDYLYNIIKRQIAKWSDILVPALAGVIGVFLVYHSLTLLLK